MLRLASDFESDRAKCESLQRQLEEQEQKVLLVDRQKYEHLQKRWELERHVAELDALSTKLMEQKKEADEAMEKLKREAHQQEMRLRQDAEELKVENALLRAGKSKVPSGAIAEGLAQPLLAGGSNSTFLQSGKCEAKLELKTLREHKNELVAWKQDFIKNLKKLNEVEVQWQAEQ